MKSRIFITTSQGFFRIDQHIWISLEFLEFVLGTSSSGDLKCVELDGLRQRSAFTYGSNISNTDVPKMTEKTVKLHRTKILREIAFSNDLPEARRHVNGHILVAFFESVVFLDVVQVISTDNDSPVHLHLSDDTSEDATTDGHFTGEGALLVNVVSILGLIGDLESQTRVAEKPGL